MSTYRKILRLALPLAAAASGLFAVPASASEYNRANIHHVCQSQYSGAIGASFYGYSPYRLYCYGVGVPAAVTYLGRPNVASFCRYFYPGRNATAVVRPGWRNPMNAWWCKRY